MIAVVAGALVVGLSLGLLGSGGSILTVPVLVLLAGQDDKAAVVESLAIVAMVAASGAIGFARQRRVDWGSVLLFGVPGALAAGLGGRLGAAVPGRVQLVVFGVVMMVAAAAMWRSPPAGVRQTPRARGWSAVDGAGVGLLTGFVGVGGGFLIVPALTVLGGLPMSLAIGTSLTLVAINAASGLIGAVATLGLGSADWRLVVMFAAVGMVGAAVGRRLGGRLPQEQLRRVFGATLAVVAVAILARSL